MTLGVARQITRWRVTSLSQVATMAKRPNRFRPARSRPREEQNRDYDSHRGSARARGYDADWERERAAHLRRFPLCAYCRLEHQRTTAATLVDHLYPHRGDRDLFWRAEWWVSSCRSCHSGFKQALERLGRSALDTLARRLGLEPMP